MSFEDVFKKIYNAGDLRGTKAHQDFISNQEKLTHMLEKSPLFLYPIAMMGFIMLGGIGVAKYIVDVTKEKLSGLKNAPQKSM